MGGRRPGVESIASFLSAYRDRFHFPIVSSGPGSLAFLSGGLRLPNRVDGLPDMKGGW
jgi:hypothetical protein